jgi:hypothetical protein
MLALSVGLVFGCTFSASPDTPQVLGEAEPATYQPVALMPCGTFPVAGLSASTGAEDLPGTEYDALRQSASSQGYDDATWRQVERAEDQVMFVADLGIAWACVSVIRTEGVWHADVEAEASQLRITPSSNLGPGSWTLKEAPTADSSTLSVGITEYACANGAPATGRVAPPLVEYRDDSITIMFGVTRLGNATCPGNPITPVVLELAQAVGNRVLVDGSVYPPATVAVP